ncbi:leucyl/phenylalanyl-tRNA--protein transferase [Balneola sp. MJW-20]|uniref:leucyl/phenylalanyl-tRNA--protein transferase n=1 Tax=Gracilimonas aurantiaca TaxID=3234185 RepID=UPI003467CAA2
MKYRLARVATDLTPDRLLEAYSDGWFAMAEDCDDKQFKWFSPRLRGILPIGGFHVGKNCKRLVRQGNYQVKVNANFQSTVEACADREWTWISDKFIALFCSLHERGYAHSVEIYDLEERFIAGQYGVALKGAFFGESLFSKKSDMDKVTLYHTHKILADNGFSLWDHQYHTQYLARMGCIEIRRKEYKKMLRKALKEDCEFKLFK